MNEATAPDRRGARCDRALRQRHRARRRRLPDVRRRGALAHGRERRGQVHADQGAHRRAPARRTARSVSTAKPLHLAYAASTRSATASAPSIRSSTCCRTCRSPRTSCSGASRGVAAASTGERMRPRGRRGAARPRARHRPGLAARQSLARRAAAGRDRARHLERRAGARARRADVEPRRRRGGRAVPRHPGPEGARASRSCSSRTSSTRCTRSATASRCCATARSSASTSPASCCASTSCRRCSARTPTHLTVRSRDDDGASRDAAPDRSRHATSSSGRAARRRPGR